MRSLLCLLLIGASVSAQRLDVLRNGFLPDVEGRVPQQAVSGDFDGDGQVDLAMVDFLSLSIAWNDGSGRFVRRGPSVPAYGALGLAAADLDGDGDLDLLLDRIGAFGGPATPILLRNDGGGSFVDVTTQWPAPNDLTVALAVFDWDGDGDLDIVTCNTAPAGGCGYPPQFCPAQNRVFRNNGRGFFTDATAQLFPHTPAAHSGIADGDLDGDGIRDLVFSVEAHALAPGVPGGLRLFLVG
ncbi:MAG: VCBS repeat-containing protein, partial [Planctomycetes bacterium]|nr:VCBS repeat-containing protein [Planctomycetota bacterium]